MREVPSTGLSAPNASQIDPAIAIRPISTGTHAIASPNGLHHATVVDGVRGNSEVFEDGKVVWQQWGGLVGELKFSTDGNHLAFTIRADDGTGWSVIEDGQIVGSGYTSLSLLSFSKDGNDLAFVTYVPGSGYEVVENGNVVSSAYFAVGDLQFNQQSDQLTFAGYQSQTQPTGNTPFILVLHVTPLNTTGEWGYADSVVGASEPIPSDPVTVVVA